MNFAEQLEQRGFDQGFQEGFKQGFKQGFDQAQRQIELTVFPKLIRHGYSKESIMDLLDLDEESFEALQAEVNENGDTR